MADVVFDRLVALLVVYSASATGGAAAQESAGVDSAIALIRTRYAAIQGARLDSTVLAYSSPGGSGSIIRLREAGQLRKLVVTFDGDGASWRLEHFYWADSLSFAFRRWEQFPENGPSRVSEQRWYVAGGQAPLRRGRCGGRARVLNVRLAALRGRR